MNKYDEIDSIYPPYPRPEREPKLLTGNLTQRERDTADDTTTPAEKPDMTLRTYWQNMNVFVRD